MKIYTAETQDRMFGLYLDRRMAENYIYQQLQDYGAENDVYCVGEYLSAGECLDAYVTMYGKDNDNPQSMPIFLQLKQYYLAENNGIDKEYKIQRTRNQIIKSNNQNNGKRINNKRHKV